jgi:glucokinase
MECKWLNPQASFETLILAGDIGGTNTNLALVGYSAPNSFVIILETVFASQHIQGLAQPIAQTLQLAQERRSDLVPSQACISAAGPVANNCCVMTNLPWTIDGDKLAQELDVPVLVVNDFLAISYGIPTLDVNNPEQITVLAHCDESCPAPQATTKAVIGPGTGMGVSYLVWDGAAYIPAGSEGGHITFAPFDEESQAFQKYLQHKLGALPGVEPLISGTGINNIYEFYRDTGKLTGAPELDAEQIWQPIQNAAPSQRPMLISLASNQNPIAADMMKLFVRMLARYASDLSALFLPLGGFYLAGGVVMKNIRWLQKDALFMTWFEQNYNPNIVPILQKTPVYIINDYSISLYGAANASVSLQKKST